VAGASAQVTNLPQLRRRKVVPLAFFGDSAAPLATDGRGKGKLASRSAERSTVSYGELTRSGPLITSYLGGRRRRWRARRAFLGGVYRLRTVPGSLAQNGEGAREVPQVCGAMSKRLRF